MPDTLGISEIAARISFARAEVLWLCAGILALFWVLAWRRGPLRVTVPSSGSGARTGMRHVAGDSAWWGSIALRTSSIVLLCAVLADPSVRLPEQPVAGSGVDLIVALDASGSMDALDGQLGGVRTSRLELAKRAVAALIEARTGDRIGLVVFGQRAYTQCPLTLDHRLVLQALARVRVGDAGDSTALGDAVGLAIRHLRAAGGRAEAQRIMVLLTDGRQNSGEISPTTAARLALREGVRAHTVGIGTSGIVPFSGQGGGTPLRFERVDLDRASLERLARATGGEFFAAKRPEDVLDVAAAIDRLEARPVLEQVPERQASLVAWGLLALLGSLALESLWNAWWMRRLP